jgi:hypothetical protein
MDQFIKTIQGATLCPVLHGRAAMFIFNRSFLAVFVALLVAALPVLIQYV